MRRVVRPTSAPPRQVLHELIDLYQVALARQGLEVVYVSFEPENGTEKPSQR